MSIEKSKAVSTKYPDLAIFISSIMAILVVILPIIGYGFAQGYFSVFGISGGVFPYEAGGFWGETYYLILIGLSYFFEILPGLLIKIVGVILFLVIAFLVAVTFFRESLKSFFDKWDEEKYGNGFFEACRFLIKSLIEDFSFHLNLIFNVVMILAAIALTMICTIKQGESYAQQKLNEFNEHGCEAQKWSRCVSISDITNPGSELFKGLLVAGSSRHIVLFDKNKLQVIPRLDTYIVTKEYFVPEK